MVFNATFNNIITDIVENTPWTLPKGSLDFRHYGCCTTSGCQCAHPRKPRRDQSSVTSGSHGTTTKKKNKKKKRDMRRAYFPSGLFPDRTSSGHLISGEKGTTRADIAQLPVTYAQNILPYRARD